MAAVLVPRLPRRRRRPPRCRRWPFVLFVYNAQIGRHVAPLAADGRRKEEEEEVEEDDRVFSYANIGRQLSTYGSPFPFPRHCLSITMGIDRRKFTANFDQRAPPPFDVSRVIDEPRAVFFFFSILPFSSFANLLSPVFYPRYGDHLNRGTIALGLLRSRSSHGLLGEEGKNLKERDGRGAYVSREKRQTAYRRTRGTRDARASE